MHKDLFSNQSKTYAKYRPTYPQQLFDYIFQFVEQKDLAWDCATGNGQAAGVLADHFKKVKASDLSEAQIKNAVPKNNIEYLICSAEQTPFPDNYFDLITIAQAYHWLNWKIFYKEATRVGKQNAVVAIWSYSLLITDDENMNRLISNFYCDIIGAYWDAERKYVDNGYATVEFDFEPLPSKAFVIKLSWNKQQLKGYLQSWSAVQNYIKKNNSSPIELIEKDLNRLWNDEEEKAIHFPLFLRIGRIVK